MMNLLLPTDFSENSRNAAAYALQFFKETACNFYLLHVIPVRGNDLSTSFMSMSPQVTSQFDNLVHWLESIKIHEQHHFHTSFKTSYLIDAVRSKVQEKNIDLILMGTKGKSNKEGAVIGRNTSDVMMKVKCPAMAIAANAVFREHKEIIFPTDYKIHYEGRMLRTLMNLASLSKADLKILEIFNSENEPSAAQLQNRDFLRASFLPKIPALQRLYLQKEQNPKKLFLANKNVDMIVLAAKDLNLCQKFLQNDQNEIPFINQLPLLMLHG